MPPTSKSCTLTVSLNVDAPETLNVLSSEAAPFIVTASIVVRPVIAKLPLTEVLSNIVVPATVRLSENVAASVTPRVPPIEVLSNVVEPLTVKSLLKATESETSNVPEIVVLSCVSVPDIVTLSVTTKLPFTVRISVLKLPSIKASDVLSTSIINRLSIFPRLAPAPCPIKILF